MELLSSTLGRARIGGYWRAVDSGNAGDAEDAEKGVLEVVDESVWEKVKEAGLYRGV